jgi:multiple sugar transport system substrate-binding protein
MSAMSSSHWDRRSLLKATAGLAAAGTLSACGSNNGRGGGSGSGKNLVQYFHAYGEPGVEQAVKRYAKAYTKANVTTQWITGNNFENKLFPTLLTKQAPDVFEFHPQIQLVKSGQVADLTDIIDPVKNDFNPADIKSHTVDGKIYGVRMIDDPQFFFYRKSMLEKANVQVPTYQAFDESFNLMGKATWGQPPLVILYKTAIGVNQDYGQGSAGAVILTLLICVVTLFQGKIMGFGRGEEST